MELKKSILIIALVFFANLSFYDANAHSMFNSAEQVIGGYRVQIATLPEIPAANERSQILIRVQDNDFNELERFTLGIRIFFDGKQIDAIPPRSYEQGHMETDYIFESNGIHIFRVDLYDVARDGGVLTYTFNVGTQNPFGYAFIISITVGAVGLAIVIGYIYIPKKIRSRL